MAMKRKKPTQDEMRIPTSDLARSPGHPFYERLNRLLGEPGFDPFVEALCAKFSAKTMGRPSVAPGVYFRMLLIGFFEGLDSERGIAWRCADSFSLRQFLGYGPGESTPDHSTLSVIRRRIDLETHQEVFTWVLEVLARHDLEQGRTVGVDATTLEANAAMRSIVRRDTGQSYQDFLTELAEASGITTPTRADRGDTGTIHTTVAEASDNLRADQAGFLVIKEVLMHILRHILPAILGSLRSRPFGHPISRAVTWVTTCS